MSIIQFEADVPVGPIKNTASMTAQVEYAVSPTTQVIDLSQLFGPGKHHFLTVAARDATVLMALGHASGALSGGYGANTGVGYPVFESSEKHFRLASGRERIGNSGIPTGVTYDKLHVRTPSGAGTGYFHIHVSSIPPSKGTESWRGY